MEIKVTLAPQKIIRYLVMVMIFFAVVSTIIQFCKYVFDYRDEWMLMFNLDREMNLPTWFSALMLAFCSLILRIIAAGKKQQSDRFTKDWQLLAFIFAYLAVDEVISIHEILIIPEVSEALNLPWFLHSMWVIPGTLVFAWFIKRFRRFIPHLPRPTKKLFVIAIATYVGGALGMEMVGSHFAESIGQQHIIYALIATVEEIMEMTGIIIFIYTFLNYLARLSEQNLLLQVNILESANSRKANKY